MQVLHLDSFVQMAFFSLSLSLCHPALAFSACIFQSRKHRLPIMGSKRWSVVMASSICSLTLKVHREVDFACRVKVLICRCSHLKMKRANYLKIRLYFFLSLLVEFSVPEICASCLQNVEGAKCGF